MVRRLIGCSLMALVCLAANFAAAEEKKEAGKAPATAPEMMRIAHEGRAMWKDFPGFKADVELAAEGKLLRGVLEVDADGGAKLTLENGEKAEWAERTLRSVVGHRAATDDYISTVEFADEDVANPLGRLMKSTTDSDKSLWRVKGDVLMEVHRFSNDSFFVISVTDVARNAEGKHLPHNFTVTTWDNATKAIKTTRQVYNDWVRIGEYDLPVKLLAVNCGPNGSRKAEQITLSGHKLLTKTTTAAK